MLGVLAEEPSHTDLSTHQTSEILEPRAAGNKIPDRAMGS